MPAVNQHKTLNYPKNTNKDMPKNHNLAKNILDAAWSKLVTYASYKAENAGRKRSIRKNSKLSFLWIIH